MIIQIDPTNSKRNDLRFELIEFNSEGKILSSQNNLTTTNLFHIGNKLLGISKRDLIECLDDLTLQNKVKTYFGINAGFLYSE